jgi:CheY-like chemotaxis protein
VQLTQARRRDLVVMDIRMPGTDGLAATAAICGDPDLSAAARQLGDTHDLSAMAVDGNHRHY